MQRDIRQTPNYLEVEALYRALLTPGTGQIGDAADIDAVPGGADIVFSGTVMERLEGTAPTRVCTTELATGRTRVLTSGPNSDRQPRYSPDARHIAFMSDRSAAGDFQLYLLDCETGAIRPAKPVDGWTEYAHWSPDGRRILLGVAGHGADVAGSQGAASSKRLHQERQGWEPSVETGEESFRWRRVWIYDLTTDTVAPVGDPQRNVWEAVWCGNDAIAAVVSPGPEEGLWYSATLHIMDARSGVSREIYRPSDQIGLPASSPDGSLVAFVEAVCSDRGVVAGNLRVLDVASGKLRSVDTHSVDVTCTVWASQDKLLVAGHRRFETVTCMYDARNGSTTELWCSQEISSAGRYVSVAALNDAGDCALIGESYTRAPEVAVIQRGAYRTIKSLDLGYADHAKAIASVRPMTWAAPDGLEIDGWLLLPSRGRPPYPLVMNLHGGPVSHWRPAWLGRSKGLPSLMLLKRGYAIFLPNPRGSAGRGAAFARLVVGDMGGADTYDCLSGLDHLTTLGLVDPARLGVMGGSYGGYMTAWLVTQDRRFAAAVASSPVTNHVSEHLTSNIPHFQRMFLADSYRNASGKYFTRSPIMYAHRARTPTLNSCGALDRCTPPWEALQFHNALLESGVTSVLLTYPGEGHGIRKFPAAIDYAARVVGWFEEHMPAAVKDDKR
ncbi:MAG TPA: S9 family peptidase [Steroidobacter sp.]|uniref:S9 family peptidase n=1 Tax=Steroidobacter sp. TaxID=1978227 RepID=UPI002ED8B6AF